MPARCQLPERVYSAVRARVPHIYKKSSLLGSLFALIYASRKLCCVKSGASDEGSRRLGSRIWLQYWSKREQVRDTERLAHRQRWAYCSRLHIMLSKGCAPPARPSDRKAAWLGCKNAHTPLAYSLLRCWQAHVIRLHRLSNCVCVAVGHKCWLLSPGSPYLNHKVINSAVSRTSRTLYFWKKNMQIISHIN